MASSYTTVSAKLGKVKPETKSISREIFDAAKSAGHEIWYMWGMGTSSEHATGRALDFMVRNEKAGDWIRNYIWTHRKRLRLQHVIWEQHITSTVTQPGVRRKMADRGSVTENHMDHVHVLFFGGKYQAPSETKPEAKPPTANKPTKKSNTEVAHDVIAGDYGNEPQRSQKLRAAGYNPAAVQAEVNRLTSGSKPVRKTVSQIANEIIGGKGNWGNGSDRVSALKKAGYDPADVQKEVNRLMTPKGESKPKLSISQVATQVLRGEWGNGDERKRKLTRAGYNYAAVQAEVNRRA
jgi:hypothetical protein